MAQLAERSRFNLLVAGSILIFCARVAQLVEHWSNKPTVAGSIPVVSIYIFSHSLTHSLKMYIHTLLSLHLPTGNVK